MARQSSSALSRLASRIMKGAQATQREIKQLADSVLSQDESRGSRTTARRAKKRTAATRKRSAKKRK